MRIGRTRRLMLAATALLLGPFSLGCGNFTAPNSPVSIHVDRTPTPESAISDDCGVPHAVDPRQFGHSTRINNKFYPLVPGTQFVLEGRANRGGGLVEHQVIFTVTDLVKVIDGVTTRVLWDRDFGSGQIQEAELAFHAQSDNGDVWNFGEYPEQYDSTGVFTGAPDTWISGINGAIAGVILPGTPKQGDKFLQGIAPDIQFLDCARVYKLDESACVPTGCYDHMLVMSERSPLEKNSGHQLKFYAPGVGNVQITAVGDPEGETLVLIQLNHLNAAQMDEARRAVFKLEKRAYQISPVYQQTAPIH